MIDFKIILCGDYGAGKTSLTVRLLRNTFNNYSSSTVGASFMTWRPDFIEQDPDIQRKLTFGIWDTAGQERFKSLMPMYLRASDAVFYCWDYTDPFDTDVADEMYTSAKTHSPDCHFYLVYTKIDTSSYFEPCTIAEKWVDEKQIEGHFYTSSLTGEGVQELFTTMAKNLAPLTKPVIQQTVNISRYSRIKKWCYL